MERLGGFLGHSFAQGIINKCGQLATESEERIAKAVRYEDVSLGWITVLMAI